MMNKKLLIPLVATLSVDNFVCILADAEEKITSNINAVYEGKYDALDSNIVMRESVDAVVSNEEIISSNIDIAYGENYDALTSSLHAHELIASKNRNREDVPRKQLREILGDQPVTEQQRSLLLAPITTSIELIEDFFNNGVELVTDRLQELDADLGAMLENFQKGLDASVVELVNENIERTLPAELQLGNFASGEDGIIDFKDVLSDGCSLDVKELYVSCGSINGLNTRLKMSEFVTTLGEEFQDGPFNELFQRLGRAIASLTGTLQETVTVSSSISAYFTLEPGVTLENASFNYDVSKDLIFLDTLKLKGSPKLELLYLSLPSIPIIDLKATLTYGPDEVKKQRCVSLQFEFGPESRNYEGSAVVVALEETDQNLGPLEPLIGPLLLTGTATLSTMLPRVLGGYVGLVQDEIIEAVNTLFNQVCI